MNEFSSAATQWLLHLAVGGGLLLLVACLLMRWTPQPARRQRLGEWGITAALLVGLLSLVCPSWLVIAWHRSEGEGDADIQREYFRSGPLMVDDIREEVHHADPAPAPAAAASPVKHDAPVALPHAVGHTNMPPDPADEAPAAPNPQHSGVAPKRRKIPGTLARLGTAYVRGAATPRDLSQRLSRYLSWQRAIIDRGGRKTRSRSLPRTPDSAHTSASVVGMTRSTRTRSSSRPRSREKAR